MEVKGMALEFQMMYVINSIPAWLSDSGKATAIINDATIKIKLLPRSSPEGVL
jgi:hypothetical protein